MKHLPPLAAVCLLIVPSAVMAQQLSPNPNPAGNTIIVDTSTASNDVSFENLGAVDIHGNGKLANRGDFQTQNDGRVFVQGVWDNLGTFGNGNLFVIGKDGYLSNAASGDVENSWQFNHSGYLINRGQVSNLYGGNGGGFTVEATGVFQNEAGSKFTSNTLFDNYGQTNGAVGSVVENSSHWNNREGGSVSVKGTLSNLEEGRISNAGNFTNEGLLINTEKNAKLTNLESGTLGNEAGATFENLDWVENQGVVINRGSLNNRGIFENDSTIHNNGVFGIGTNGEMFNGGQWLNEGAVENQGDFFNNGSVQNKMSGSFSNLNNFSNTGNLTNDVGGVFTNSGSLGNEDNASVLNDGTLFNASSFTNKGMLTNRAQLTNDGTLTNSSGGTLTNDGTIDTSDGTYTNNGTYNGNGKIIGDLTDYGVTRPGNTAGVMTIDGDYFKVEGSKEIELGGLFDGGDDKSLTEHDWLDVGGNVELAGTLTVSLLGGFDLHRGNVFNFLRVGGTLSGQYEGLDEGALVGTFGDQDLFITYVGGDGNDVALFTNVVPEPATVLIWSMLAGLGMTVRRRR